MFSCQKHFSKVNPVQNDNNNNKIVVKKSKRASSSASDLSENEEGAMTLEASLIVPIFLIVLLMLTSAGEILMIHQQISHGACEAAKRAAVNEYRIRQKKKSGSDLSGFSAKAAFLAAVNRKFLDHSALIGGSAGAAAACRLTLTSKGEYIVSVRYYIRKTMPFLSTHTASYEQSVRQKSMTGYIPGTIFLDHGCDKSFISDNNIIYGHHMKNGTMFAKLLKFREESFLKKHHVIILYTPKKTMHLKVISAYAVKAQDQMPITFANETQKKEYITKIRRMSEPSIKLDDKKIDRIYTFVTCSYERDDNRTYVHAVEE